MESNYTAMCVFAAASTVLYVTYCFIIKESLLERGKITEMTENCLKCSVRSLFEETDNQSEVGVLYGGSFLNNV